VRTREWQLDSVIAEEEGSVIAVLSTESDASTRRWWPHEFRLALRITIGSTLGLELAATNTGSAPFSFEEALHTYFRVGQSASVRVRGLDGVNYLDNVDQNREKTQYGELVLTGTTDNAYLNIESAAELVDPVLRRTVRTEKENSRTTVVWNPWQHGAASLSDLGEDEWQQMTCVEASNVLSWAVRLGPGEKHTMRAKLSIAPE
jgi:glucose-6-phosphate 1-epimerase